MGYPVDRCRRLAGLMKRVWDQTSVTVAAILSLSHHDHQAGRADLAVVEPRCYYALTRRHLHILDCLAKTFAGPS